MVSAVVFQQLEERDRVLYNQKKHPLQVIRVAEDEIVVRGPEGGEYLLFPAPDDTDVVLESRSGNREYASRVENLRIVGEWEAIGENRWEHTETGATVSVEKTDAGYWGLTIEDFNGAPPDVPKYGFLKKTYAVAEAKTFMADNPEG